MQQDRELHQLYLRIVVVEQCIEGCDDPSQPTTSEADKVQIQQMLERTLLNLKLRAEALERSMLQCRTEHGRDNNDLNV